MRAVIPVVFFALAAWFLLGARAASPPLPEPVALEEGALALGPLRAALKDPPSVEIAGYEQTCQACHKLFESQPLGGRRELLQHTHIELDHGLNNDCYNCHSIADRDKLILVDGTEVAYEDVVELCARCHGTTFRDWELGMHGKTTGSWDASSGEQSRFKCTDCHDPHRPAFDPVRPLPGPNTLRMGLQEPRSHSSDENPLQRWSRNTHGHQDER
jgi:hypothetical protein